MRLRLQMPKNEEIGLFQRAHRLELAARVSLQLPGSAGCSDSAPGPRCTGGRFPTLAMGFSSSGGEEEKNIWVLGLGFYLWALLTSLIQPKKYFGCCRNCLQGWDPACVASTLPRAAPSPRPAPAAPPELSKARTKRKNRG